jgi:hypothetical protein
MTANVLLFKCTVCTLLALSSWVHATGSNHSKTQADPLESSILWFSNANFLPHRTFSHIQLVDDSAGVFTAQTLAVNQGQSRPLKNLDRRDINTSHVKSKVVV